MDFIEKVEIKHFRSFDGGKDQTKVKIDDLRDLNVFSGANDSGKSNILRALNLFFNDELAPGTKFDKTRDFSKIASRRFDQDIAERKAAERQRIKKIKAEGGDERARDLRRSDEVVSIKLFFNNSEAQRGLPKKFWISKIFSQQNNFEGAFSYPANLKGNAQVTLFLQNFQFEYVPAIKDRTFFNQLFQKLQTFLFEKEDKKNGNKFSAASANFNEALTSETKQLFQEFQKSSGVEANFHIPSTLVDFFRTLSVRTEDDVSLFDRGDGIQARFIPEILEEISRGSKKNIIWGFEEPENSYEAKNIRKIRDDFLQRYSRQKQIFVTTHTKEFLSVRREYTTEESEILDDPKISTQAKRIAALAKLSKKRRSSDVSIYRVWKGNNSNGASLITRFDELNGAWDETCDDLGLIQEARMVEDLQSQLFKQAELIEDSQLSAEKQEKIRCELADQLQNAMSEYARAQTLIEEYQKPILIVEDKYSDIYQIAYLKTAGIPFKEDNLELVFKEKSPFVIRRAEGAGHLSGKLRMKNTDGYDDKRLLGLFDFDKEGTENFYCLKRGIGWADEILGDLASGFFKKRQDHPCFYAMLLPVPDRLRDIVSSITDGRFESFVEIENLLSKEFLIDNQLVNEAQILDKKYLKVNAGAKRRMKKIAVGLEKKEFKDFQPLFDKITELFEL
ncbi:MAG: AAA family ATPase [Rhizobiaceae bacterium]